MRILLQITLIFPILTLSNCKKSSDTNPPVTPINCDGLVTDTLGTGDNGRLYFPNAFSPNNDGLNDLSRPLTQNISSLTFTVYDANNSVVFSTSTAPYTWTTTVSGDSATTYYYKIQATTNSNRHIGLCGKLYKLSCFPASIPKSSLFFGDQLNSNGTYAPNSIESLPNCP